jgi:hypothetical protein
MFKPVVGNKRSVLQRMLSSKHPAQCPLVIAPHAGYPVNFGCVMLKLSEQF